MKISQYKIGKIITVNDRMQKDYSYQITAKIGDSAFDFNQYDFNPHFTPAEMLKLGVFEGCYLNDCEEEFPEEWFINSATKRSSKPNVQLNYFQIKSRLSLQKWRENKWIVGDDPRGWFQWYCRYYLGRRTSYDLRQIKRWKSYKRHLFQVKAHCNLGDYSCRPRQRQSLLQWAYNSML